MFDLPKGFFETLLTVFVISLVLGCWKLVDIAIWLWHHVQVTVK